MNKPLEQVNGIDAQNNISWAELEVKSTLLREKIQTMMQDKNPILSTRVNRHKSLGAWILDKLLYDPQELFECNPLAFYSILNVYPIIRSMEINFAERIINAIETHPDDCLAILDACPDSLRLSGIKSMVKAFFIQKALNSDKSNDSILKQKVNVTLTSSFFPTKNITLAQYIETNLLSDLSDSKKINKAFSIIEKIQKQPNDLSHLLSICEEPRNGLSKDTNTARIVKAVMMQQTLNDKNKDSILNTPVNIKLTSSFFSTKKITLGEYIKKHLLNDPSDSKKFNKAFEIIQEIRKKPDDLSNLLSICKKSRNPLSRDTNTARIVQALIAQKDAENKKTSGASPHYSHNKS